MTRSINALEPQPKRMPGTIHRASNRDQTHCPSEIESLHEPESPEQRDMKHDSKPIKEIDFSTDAFKLPYRP